MYRVNGMYSEMCVSNLLHMAEDVLPAVKHSSSLLSVQLVNEVSGEVLIAVLISKTHTLQKGNGSVERFTGITKVTSRKQAIKNFLWIYFT